jgi:hypothetical protein
MQKELTGGTEPKSNGLNWVMKTQKKNHTVATKNYRRNLITHLKEPEDSLIFSHDHKAAIIWESYKNRLGISEATSMQFNLHDMIEAHDLHHLDSPFTPKEIEAVVKEMAPDKAPGPDGFNGHFLKKCWPIVKLEFINLINDFYEENLNLEAINTAFITLIPKASDPCTMNDFKPISLVSLPLKFITKIMENRLQLIIIPTLHKNQYGFIKGRNIQD